MNKTQTQSGYNLRSGHNLTKFRSDKGYTLITNRLHRGPFTKKIIKQLQSEPKVVISPDLSCDHNVPDLSDIANEVDVTTFEEIASCNPIKSAENRRNSDISLPDIERTNGNDEIENELRKMYNVAENVENSAIINNTTILKRKIHHNRTDKTKELLLILFGEDSDDNNILIKNRKIEKSISARRNSLPISLNLPTDDIIRLRETIKNHHQTCDISYETTTSIPTENYLTETIMPIMVVSELEEKVKIMHKPIILTHNDIIKNEVGTNVIDLTGNEDRINYIQPEIKNEQTPQQVGNTVMTTQNVYPPLAMIQNQITNLQNNQQPPAPRLLPIVAPTIEYILISYGELAERIVPHLLTFIRWSLTVRKFGDDLRTFLPKNDWQIETDLFNRYVCESMQNFGRKLLKDLLLIDVHVFNFFDILKTVEMRLAKHQQHENIFRICLNLYRMLKGVEGLCSTPFTRKFFFNVKGAVKEMETRLLQKEYLTVLQLQQLHNQILQYHRVQKWLNDYWFKQKQLKIRQQQIQKRVATMKRLAPAPPPPQKPPPPPPPLPLLLQQSSIQKRIEEILTHANIQRQQLNQQTNENPPPTQINQRQIIVSSVLPTVINRSDVGRQSEKCINTPPPPPPPQPVVPVMENPPIISEQQNCSDDNPVTTTDVKEEDEGVIDLTWIDEGDDVEILDAIHDLKNFPLKEENVKNEEGQRESVSPADSGLGSPGNVQGENSDPLQCLCGKDAIYVCICNSSMYCSRNCQINDWTDHQKWCKAGKT